MGKLVSFYSDYEINNIYDDAVRKGINLPTFWDAKVIDSDKDWTIALIQGREVLLPTNEIYGSMIIGGPEAMLVCSQYAAEDAGLL